CRSPRAPERGPPGSWLRTPLCLALDRRLPHGLGVPLLEVSPLDPEGIDVGEPGLSKPLVRVLDRFRRRGSRVEHGLSCFDSQFSLERAGFLQVKCLADEPVSHFTVWDEWTL